MDAGALQRAIHTVAQPIGYIVYAFMGCTFNRLPSPRPGNSKGHNASSYMTDLPGYYVIYRGSERERGNKVGLHYW